MSRTRIKVSREALLKRLRAEREKIIAQHGREVAKYETTKSEFVSRLQKEVDAFSVLLDKTPEKALKRTGGTYRNRNHGEGTAVYFNGVTFPTEPHSPSTHKLDRHIRVLEISDEDTISVGAEDEYANYL